MKRSIFLTCASLCLLLVSCGKKSLDLPATTDQSFGLNSSQTFITGYNAFNTKDYVMEPSKIDSVTCDTKTIQVSLNEDKSKVIIDVWGMKPLANIAIWVEGVPYSILAKRTDKIDYTFRYNPNGKRWKRVQIAGQMNDWYPDFHPDLTLNENGEYEVTMNLTPGTYLYQLVRDGDWNHDETNPEKVDNNGGKFNSILHVNGTQNKAPILLTQDFNKTSFTLSSINHPEQLYVYWQNYLLPGNFIKATDDEITVTLPKEAEQVQRSFIRVYAANKFGVSNDILVPLEYGQVIDDISEVTRFDKHAEILYSLMVDRFVDGKKENNHPMNRPDVLPQADYHGGDLAGITQKIKDGFFNQMGFTTIWLTPVVQNPLEPYGGQENPKTKFAGYHGYWPISSTKVDFRFGTEEELKEMVEVAHEHGLNVILDYVANHVHKKHPMFVKDPSICTPLYLPDGTKNIAQWNAHRLTTWFDEHIPTLDYNRHEIVETMTDSALYWIQNYNLDGFRHDACKHVQEDFWRTLTYKIKTRVEIPNQTPFYQVGESYGSPALISSYVNSGMLNAQFDFNVSDDAANVFALNREDFHRISNTLNMSLRTYGCHNLMGYISGNHDRGRFASYASGDLSYAEDSKWAGWHRNVGIKDSTGYDKVVQLNTFNMTIPGCPVVYYGDEFGMPGGNDPDCRRMMRFDDELNAKELETRDKVASVAHLRKTQLPLIYGDFIELYLSRTTWAYARNYFGKTIITVFNRDVEPAEIEIVLPKMLMGKNYKANFDSPFSIEENVLKITIPANGVDILVEK